MCLKSKFFWGETLIFLIYCISLAYANTRLTYLEFTTLNVESNSYLDLNENGNELLQEFIMPYSIFNSIGLKIGTNQRDNNSVWKFTLFDKEGDMIYSEIFNASQISDNDFYLIKGNSNIKVNKSETYQFSIKAHDVTSLSSLSFMISDNNRSEDLKLFKNGEQINGGLCYRIYGGEIDYWWHRLFTFGFIIFSILVIRIHWLIVKKKRIREDAFLNGLALGVIIFVLLCSFSNGQWFTDENDNIRGGMIIADGGVLYRDYITQHTPVMYYLCSVFALFGAGSIQQFRLSYYIFESLIWMFLYYRHSSFFGKKRFIILALAEVIVIPSIISPQGFQILSDGFQGLMFMCLLLEFIRYYNDKNLDCKWRPSSAAFAELNDRDA